HRRALTAALRAVRDRRRTRWTSDARDRLDPGAVRRHVRVRRGRLPVTGGGDAHLDAVRHHRAAGVPARGDAVAAAGTDRGAAVCVGAAAGDGHVGDLQVPGLAVGLGAAPGGGAPAVHLDVLADPDGARLAEARVRGGHGAVEADEREVRAVGVGLDAVGDGAAAVLVQAADAEGQPAAGDAVLGGEDPGRRDDRGRAGLPAVGEQARGPGTAGGVTAADDG